MSLWMLVPWVGAILLVVPVVILLVQILLALFPGSARKSIASRSVENARVAVLVPAHNESTEISATLKAIFPQLIQGDRLMVVADNCTDDTAAMARALGAEVVERQDLSQRGKGFALDFGVRHLCADPPDVLLIIDADCHLGSGSLRILANLAMTTQRPVQALYLMTAPSGAGLGLRIAEFAWRVKNWTRPLGWMRLGGPCHLMGTGMAFPWSIAAHMSLANGHLVEDMKLGIDLALQGMPPVFCPNARVTSEFPSGERAARTQRTRWEHGHLGMIVSYVPKLLWQGLRRMSSATLILGLDLLVPPLALLAGLLFLMICLALALYLYAKATVFLIVIILVQLVFSLSIFLAWMRWGREVVSLSELLSIPTYIAGKLPVYLAFLFSRQTEWIRTERTDEAGRK
jgi:cellulose synthase/poly-beta-1,6-N-acetylglucosamine synthase-like glycosyltransferase